MTAFFIPSNKPCKLLAAAAALQCGVWCMLSPTLARHLDLVLLIRDFPRVCHAGVPDAAAAFLVSLAEGSRETADAELAGLATLKRKHTGNPGTHDWHKLAAVVQIVANCQFPTARNDGQTAYFEVV